MGMYAASVVAQMVNNLSTLFINQSKPHILGLPCGKDSTLPLQGGLVTSLVRELKLHVLGGAVKKNKNKPRNEKACILNYLLLTHTETAFPLP